MKTARPQGSHRSGRPLLKRVHQVNGGRSMLAARAIEGRPATLNDALHRAAARAGLTLPVVNGEGFREVPELARWAREVAKGRTTCGDGLFEHRMDRWHQLAHSRGRDRTTRTLRIYCRAVQCLADVDIAEACDDALI